MKSSHSRIQLLDKMLSRGGSGVDLENFRAISEAPISHAKEMEMLQGWPGSIDVSSKILQNLLPLHLPLPLCEILMNALMR